MIRAGEITLPANVDMLTDAEEVVVRIEVARVEEVVEAEIEEAASAPEPESAEGEAGA